MEVGENCNELVIGNACSDIQKVGPLVDGLIVKIGVVVEGVFKGMVDIC